MKPIPALSNRVLNLPFPNYIHIKYIFGELDVPKKTPETQKQHQPISSSASTRPPIDREYLREISSNRTLQASNPHSCRGVDSWKMDRFVCSLIYGAVKSLVFSSFSRCLKTDGLVPQLAIGDETKTTLTLGYCFTKPFPLRDTTPKLPHE